MAGPCAHESIDINVDNVSLGLLRIKQQNKQGTKSELYVPVWAFYGLAAYKSLGGEVSYSRGDIPEGPHIILAVNAVDNSLIDVAVGY